VEDRVKVADNEMTVMDDELTVFTIGEKRFELREMKIGRTRKLYEKIFLMRDEIDRRFLRNRKSDENIDPVCRHGPARAQVPLQPPALEELLDLATPLGVPVKMTSPGWSDMN